MTAAAGEAAGPGDTAGSVLTLASSRGRVALFATVAASGMASLDATVINVALPRIGEDLDAGVGALQWILTGYLLALASLILLGGTLGDRWGRRRVFVGGTVWFALASMLCGLAPTVEALVVARILQGAGAALLTPGSLAILQASFVEQDRARAVGAWSGLSGVAGAIGPFVGGWVVDGPGWRWAFLLNLPVAVAVVAATWRAVPETRDRSATGPLDVGGALLAVFGLAAATWGLTAAGERGWADGPVIAALVAAAIAAAAFVARERAAANPLVPPALFANRTFAVTNVVTVLLYAPLGVAFFLVAYELQVAAGWSAFAAGVAMLPTTVLMLVLSARSGALSERIGPRLPLTAGALLAGIGLWMLSGLGTDAVWLSDVAPGAVVLGLGLVLFVAPLTEAVMGSVPAGRVGTASGVNNAVARTAGLAAVAVVPVVAGLTTARHGTDVAGAAQRGLRIVAVVAVVAAPVAFVGLTDRRTRRSARRFHCAVGGPPIQPDPQRCPVS
ncbi:MAG: DHA2 family efflux MFS transporter permease subunit [Desertimonas sp.]